MLYRFVSSLSVLLKKKFFPHIGLGYLLYNQIISRHLHDEKRYWFSKWIPTTWTYFVNKLQNEEISSITLMEQFIFYQDNKGELFS
jgi:hypothetical protein